MSGSGLKTSPAQ